jgi:hypothetical protein
MANEAAMKILAASVASATLVLLGALHVYWASGGAWPARDPDALATYVLGSNRDRMPPRLLTLCIALVLFVFAWLPLAHALALASMPLALRSMAVPLYTLAAVFALRGLGGFVEQRIQPSPPHWPYVRLNKQLYSPLCLALAALLYASVG